MTWAEKKKKGKDYFKNQIKIKQKAIQNIKASNILSGISLFSRHKLKNSISLTRKVSGSFLRLWISATIFLGCEFLNFLDGNLGIAELAASKILLIQML
ncbi:hypothetical protein BpHYR1_009125 [Brachionus plicatilis]|uniref:Uncharacterized protein n=1 Tax=Brachionus plicatilis TaxID=10195 RepID=A0A3M7SFN4_BRAPC|nr:hypothetical protein BpHYR1_009125 [Brachionus plicatilis]